MIGLSDSGGPVLARTIVRRDAIRFSVALLALVVALVLLVSLLADSFDAIGRAEERPVLTITLDDRANGSSDDAPAEPEPNAKLNTVISVVREHRTRADDAWCITLAEAIYAESVASDVDPLLIASIVAVESSFQSQAVSPVGAVGLMQLRPFVAADIASRENIAWAGDETLHVPHLNVRMGIRYYQELLDRFGGDISMALTAYNRGPTRVSRALRSGSYAGSAYADRVLRGYEALRTEGIWPASRRRPRG